jgi:hypothetical protein
MINPGADVSYKFYFGVPLMSGISVSAGSSSFQLMIYLLIMV